MNRFSSEPGIGYEAELEGPLCYLGPEEFGSYRGNPGSD